MTLNQDQAQHNNDQLRQEAQISEILAIIQQDGPLHCGAIAQRVGLSPWDCRAHLAQMVGDGELDYNWLRGYSV